jgi:hypothetical protein
MLASSRLKLVLLVAGMFVLALPQRASAQEDATDAPLGDVARSFRKITPSSTAVIDNENFSKVMDDAESQRTAGSSPVFTLDPGGKTFHVSSPDVSCSLSFSAKTSSLLSDPVDLDEMPRSELAKLDGPATLDGDSLQVSMHNGTSWELREVVIGLTIVKRPDAVDSAQQAQDSLQKQPDVTLLLRIKGSAAPSATAMFRTPLNFALFPDQEWHWAIVRAKGIPPQTPPPAAATTQPEHGTGQVSQGTPPVSSQTSALTSSPSQPGAAAH